MRSVFGHILLSHWILDEIIHDIVSIHFNNGQQPYCLHFKPTYLKSNRVKTGQCWKVSNENHEAGGGIIQGLRF